MNISLIEVCAWCSKRKDETGNYVPCEPATLVGQPVTHGVCPACAKKQREILRLEIELMTQQLS